MILTNNLNLYEKCKSLRNLCFGFGKKRFDHDDIGWNYRMTNLQAAIGCGQLKNINKINLLGIYSHFSSSDEEDS